MPTFDGDNLLITLDSGVTEVDWKEDVFSGWKDWLLSAPENRGYPQGFRVEGGSSINQLLDSGTYFYMQNQLGWRLKPPEEDINITVTGNMVGENSALPLVLPTTGAYTVFINGLQPITQAVSSAFETAIANITRLQYLIEFLRISHSITGDIRFVSPYSGSDSLYDGSLPGQAFATITAALAASSDGDGIFLVADDPAGTTTLVEHIDVNKEVSIRGPGEHFVIAPTTDLNDGYKYATVYIGHNSVEVSGFKIKTGPGTTRVQRGLKIDADRVLAENIVIEDAHDIGVYVQNADDVHLKNIRIKGADNVGVYTQTGDSPILMKFENCHFDNCVNKGFRIYEGVDVFIVGATVVRNSGQGFDITSDCTNLYIDPSYISTNNITDDSLAPTNLFFLQDKFKDRIWTPGLPGNETLNKILWGAK